MVVTGLVRVGAADSVKLTISIIAIKNLNMLSPKN